MKYIYLLLILFFCTGCSCPVHVAAAHRVMNSFTKKMEREGFHLCSSGGAMMDDIKQITLDYEICQNVNVDEARIIFIKYAESLLEQVNSDIKIRPYLHNYPFTSENILFGISFCKPDGNFADPPYIADVLLQNKNNRVFYSVHNKQTELLDDVYSESYEEALNIYMKNQQF